MRSLIQNLEQHVSVMGLFDMSESGNKIYFQGTCLGEYTAVQAGLGLCNRKAELYVLTLTPDRVSTMQVGCFVAGLGD